MSMVFYFFLFKQKTAYELRISDWSSDVCSSDLGGKEDRSLHDVPPQLNRNAPEIGVRVNAMGLLEAFLIVEVRNELLVRPVIIGLVARYPLIFYDRHHAAMRGVPVHRVMIDMIVDRSEEHTSELQSLLRISYAVFC